MGALLWLAATALVAAADEPKYKLVVELDNIWGPSCIEVAEKALGRLEGVKSALVRGPGRDKFFYHLEVLETKTLLPAHFDKLMKDLAAKDPDAEYPFRSLEIEAAGTVAKEGEGYVFTARGSKQKYTLLKPSDGLKKLIAAGKTQLTVSGRVEEPPAKGGQKPLPLIEVSEAREEAAK